MVDQAVNFKKMADERYRVYRIIRSNQLFTPMYRYLLKMIGHYKGAIIFPEQLIGVTRLYGVSLMEFGGTASTANSVSCETLSVAEVRGPDGEKPIIHAEDVLDFEQKVTDASEFFKIAHVSNAGYYSLVEFAVKTKREGTERFWFSNSRDAIKFAQSQIRF